MDDASIPTFCQRRADRRSVSMPALAALRECDLTDVTLTDLSYEGCRIETAEALPPGVPIELRVARLGIIEGEIRWSRPGTAGVRFAA